MSPRVVLIGLPGSGKTTVGAALATLLGVPFADSDDLVIAMTGRSIGDIFGHDGEPAFREIEAAAVTDALLDFDGVLALGGGAVTTPSVRQELASTEVPVVLLVAGQHELLRRIAGTTHRPLLAGNAQARLAELATAREPLYRDVARTVLDTGGRSVEGVAADVADYLAEFAS
jgi:shikimate kinase